VAVGCIKGKGRSGMRCAKKRNQSTRIFVLKKSTLTKVMGDQDQVPIISPAGGVQAAVNAGQVAEAVDQ